MVTDEMVEKAANAIAEKRGYVWPGTFDAEEIKIGRENMRAALEAALSAAEPEMRICNSYFDGNKIPAVAQGWNPLGFDWETVVVHPDRSATIDNIDFGKLYAVLAGNHPAPSVAVKALQDHVLADFTHLTDAQALSGPYIVKRIKERFGSFTLSAQVQDVACLLEVVEAMARFDGRNNNSHLKQMAKDALAAYRTAPAKQEG